MFIGWVPTGVSIPSFSLVTGIPSRALVNPAGSGRCLLLVRPRQRDERGIVTFGWSADARWRNFFRVHARFRKRGHLHVSGGGMNCLRINRSASSMSACSKAVA